MEKILDVSEDFYSQDIIMPKNFNKKKIKILIIRYNIKKKEGYLMLTNFYLDDYHKNFKEESIIFKKNFTNFDDLNKLYNETLKKYKKKETKIYLKY